MAENFDAPGTPGAKIEIPTMRTPKRGADGDQKGNPSVPSLPGAQTKASMISDMARVMAHMSPTELAELHEAMLGEGPEDFEDEDFGDEDFSDEGEENIEELANVDVDTTQTGGPIPGQKKGGGEKTTAFNNKNAPKNGVGTGVKVKVENLDLATHLEALKKAGTEAGLSEDFLTKLTPIFETAVAGAIEQLAATEEELVAEARDSLVADLDSYCDVAVTEWMDRNEIAVETSLQNEIASSFMANLRGLFEDHYLHIPETKRDIVEELAAEKEDLETAYADLADRLASIEGEYESLVREMIVRTECADLTEAEVDKLLSMSADLTFEGADQFSEKVKVIRENYFGGNAEVLAETNDTFEQPKAKETQAIPSLLDEALHRMSPYRGRRPGNSK